MNRELICENISAAPDGGLLFAGQRVTDLAKEYGTPLYLMDEARLRSNCRMYRAKLLSCFPKGSRVLYAGKANAFRQIYRILSEEEMGIDVVSAGEIQTALSAGYDMTDAVFHGNAKTDEEIRFAMDSGVGCIAVDNLEELLAIEEEAAARHLRQKLLLRLTPGIDPHTYAAVNTGMVDSKFGVAIETGQAEELTKTALSLPHIDLAGFHCHVGSQVFGEDVFERSAVVMLEFIRDMADKLGFTARELDLGGGYGVRYIRDDPVCDIPGRLEILAETIRSTCRRLDLPEPAILLEPGRSICADAGMTIYSVVTVKKIPGYKNYVAVDGGMTDNPRFALYGSRYTCLPAEELDAPREMSCAVVGRCCESGDILLEETHLPENIKRGDLLAVCTTGAYNYSMASNYNRVPRPPIVLLRPDGTSSIAVKRESLQDLIRLDE